MWLKIAFEKNLRVHNTDPYLAWLTAVDTWNELDTDCTDRFWVPFYTYMKEQQATAVEMTTNVVKNKKDFLKKGFSQVWSFIEMFHSSFRECGCLKHLNY